MGKDTKKSLDMMSHVSFDIYKRLTFFDDIRSSFALIMKFTTVFAVLATLAAAVSAAPVPEMKSNARRLAVGLPPNPPVRRDAAHVLGM